MTAIYRPDIDGLRALAIIPVMLFHADVAFVSGGFVGVDIFFVISGYLITNILIDNLEKKEFSILTFYERRIRRIFPALFVVLISITLVALLVMLPHEINDYGKGLLATAFFTSNYHFMSNAGYFAAPSDANPLLHMWSLAVEEQFYILFPILLYFCNRFFKEWLREIIIVLLMISLIYSSVLVYYLPIDSFFSTPARGWELMMGAILALSPREKSMATGLADTFSFIALALIFYSVIFYSETTAFPGAAALLPVVGTSLLIYAGSTTNSNIVFSLLSMPILRFIGVISYPLYLWHWPVFVFYKNWTNKPLSELEIALLMLIVFILSYLTWRFIERPFRTRQLLLGRRKMLLTGGYVILASVFCSSILAYGNGFPMRFSTEINQILEAKEDDFAINNCKDIEQNTKQELKICSVGDDEKTTVTFAVWGDSHGKSMLPAIDASARKNKAAGIFFGKGGCLTLLGVHQSSQGYKRCADRAEAFIMYLVAHPEIKQVVLISRWALYAMGERFQNETGDTIYIRDSDTKFLSLEENRSAFNRAIDRTLSKLAAMGLEVVIVTQVPEAEMDIPVAAARAMHRGNEFKYKLLVKDYLKRQEYVNSTLIVRMEKYPIVLVKPQDRMCDELYCSLFEDGVPIYKDTNHITASFAVKLANIFDPVFRKNTDTE